MVFQFLFFSEVCQCLCARTYCIICDFTKKSHMLWPPLGWKRLLSISKLKGSPPSLRYLPDGLVCRVPGYVLLLKNKISGFGKSFLPSGQSSWDHKSPLLPCEEMDFTLCSPFEYRFGKFVSLWIQGGCPIWRMWWMSMQEAILIWPMLSSWQNVILILWSFVKSDN